MSREKLRAAILFVVENCPPDRLGAVKLHKVLYYADMLMFIDSGRPLTGAEYRKRPFGPTCDSALRVLSDLQRERAINIRDVDYFGYKKREFSSARPGFDTNVLNSREKDVLTKMIEFVCFDNSAKSISDFSHDLPWQMVELGDVIPYHSALHLVPSVVPVEALDWAEAEGQKIVSERPESEAEAAVAGNDSTVLRGRMVASLGRA